MSSNNRKNIAVILASGSGLRFKSKVPKQFVRLAGKPVIQYTIEAFDRHDLINEIIIVTLPNYLDYVSELVTISETRKVAKIIGGGAERYESTWAALQAIPYAECNLIIHDAVRPFVSGRIITESIKALDSFNAVDVVVGATDTIVEVKDNFIESVPDRRYLKRGQTPQSFKKSTLMAAYHQFMLDEARAASDDCGIVLKYLPDEKIYTVEGEEENFKITHQQDVYLADSLLKDGLVSRLGVQPELIKQRLSGKVLVIFGGSAGIGAEIAQNCREFGATVCVLSRSVGGVDVRQFGSVLDALARVEKRWGAIDYVINTAGTLKVKPFVNMTEVEISEIFETNYLGVINVSRAAYKHLKKSKGMLINFASSSYSRGRRDYSIYSSTKAAVVNFSQALAEEWGVFGIKVNVINPERTATGMRFANFGYEPPESLLSPALVAEFTLATLSFDHTGQVFSIKNDLA